MDYLFGSHQLVTVGYEFEHERYSNVNTDQNPVVALRNYNSTFATQQSNAAFAQDQIRLFGGKLLVLLSGRFTQMGLTQPTFVGGLSPYSKLPLPTPPAAYTGDASFAYFAASTSTKLRAHVGNSFRMPSIYERFGGYFYGGLYVPIGNPELAPERAVSVDFGFDQYLFDSRLKLSATYFFSHLQQVIGYLDFPPGYVDQYGRFSGYYNTTAGISRGVELSGNFHPARRTTVTASYTFVNAKDRVSQYYTGTAVDPIQTPRIPPHTATVVAMQQIGNHVDFSMDLDATSSYLYPLYGAIPGTYFDYPYAFRFPGARQLGVAGGYESGIGEKATFRLYARLSNALNQDFYEDGFRTPKRWLTGGIAFRF
jgi:outer membrane receptor protein involved in Fe transport